MMDFLWQTYHRLIAELRITQHRFLYDQLTLEHRLIGIVGPRGVGKTTLLLQYIKENLYQEQNAFYFSADNMYFNNTTLLACVNELYQSRHIRYIFIDEIHKYANWNQELKNIYDSFPDVHIIFSGSSSIDLVAGSYDLSRRAKLLQLPGLSFREYLNFSTEQQWPTVSLEDLLIQHQAIAQDVSQQKQLMEQFNEYLSFGYYPMVFENANDLYDALGNVIEKTIYEDIANFYTLKTNNLAHFKRILNFLASIPPGNINTNNLATNLQIDNKTAENYLDILKRTGMIKMLYPKAHGRQVLTKPAKVYLDNTTLHQAINTFLSEPVEIGTLRELAFMQFLCGAKHTIFYPKLGDFQIEDMIFEVGGKNKIWAQLQEIEGRKFLVKDQLLIGYDNVIPLYLFGFLY
jgi:predicted AAA+ superfamily ATPase